MAPKHALFVALPAYSHARTLFNAAHNLVDFDKELLISFVCHISQQTTFEKIIDEKSVDKRLRLFPVGSMPQPSPAAVFEMMEQTVNFALEVLEDLRACKVPRASLQNNVAACAIKPTMLLADMFCNKLATTVVERSLPNLHVALWMPSTMGVMVMKQDFPNKQGDVLTCPGVASLHKHEMFPASTPFPPDALHAMEQQLDHVLHHSNITFVAPTLPSLQPEATALVADGFVRQGRQFFPLGFQFNRELWEENTALAPASPVTQFLGTTLKSHGPKSVLYVSTGTLFWPTQPYMIDALLDAIVEAELPTIFITASPMITPSQYETIAQKLKSTGIVIPWADQAAVFQHPAVGYVLAHGGFGGAFEALLSGHPSIIWPFAADQPLHGAYLAKSLNVSIELLQTRDLMVSKELYNYPDVTVTATEEAVRQEFKEVIQRITGKEGKQLRANAESLANRLRQSKDADTGNLYANFIGVFGKGMSPVMQ